MAERQTDESWLKRHRRVLLGGGVVVVALASAYFYLTGGRYVATDDAYVEAARATISANISGRVVELAVRDNQEVRQGDVLFKLDDRDLVIAVDEARARLAVARLKVAALKATFRQRLADLREARETQAYQEREFERQKNLAARGISSQAQLEQAQHAVASAAQEVSEVEQQRENIRAELGDNPDLDVDRHPSVRQEQAALDRAELNLSYAVIRAPFAGIVTKVERLQVGDYVRAAAPVFALMSRTDVWVEANFKETDLTYLQVGQPATVEVDAYPGHTFHGKIVSASPGTGSSFSLLPPENATGNWVKVVQRLPVRISIEDANVASPLHAGLSVLAEADTGHNRLERYR